MDTKHKDLISKATIEQWRAAALAYVEHINTCVELKILPSTFAVFFAEWLECEGRPEIEQ